MKALFFHPANDFSGSTTALANLIEHDYPTGSVTVVTDGEGMLSHLPNVKIMQVPRLRGRRIFGLTYFSKLLGMFWTALTVGKSYDTFYLNTIMVYPVAIASWFRDVHVKWHIHERFTYGDNKQSLAEHRFMEWVFDHTKAERIFVSKYLMDQYREREDCPSRILYNYLSRNFCAGIRVKPVAERSRRRLILVTSLTKAKGLMTCVRLAARMADYEFCMVISSDKTAIDKFFGEVAIPVNLKIYAKQRDVRPFLESSDILLNLSIPFFWVETFGMTIIEGMAYGLPSVVPNVGGPCEIVHDGYNGYTADVTNVDVLEGLIRKLSEKDNYERMAANALAESEKYQCPDKPDEKDMCW